jgi:excisionase family DNA binding protein
MDTYLSTQEVADRLGVSVFTIRRYIRAGKLKAVRLDAGYRVSRESIAEFLRAHEMAAPPELAGLPGPPSARPEADEASKEGSSTNRSAG